MTRSNYTFGDSDEASRRLRSLAKLYEPETRSLLQRSEVQAPLLAVDLGCGPGWSTRLIHEVLNPRQTIGLDSSARYIAEASKSPLQNVQFLLHDITQLPFPTPSPDVMFCRFLLTHLPSPERVLAHWKQAAQTGTILLIHETESLESEHPSLLRYYERVGQLQEHYGQKLEMGAVLEGCVREAGWEVLDSAGPIFLKPAQLMAQLHAANIRNWRKDEYASKAFDAEELDRLEASLSRIACGEEDAGIVRNRARQIIARC